jgi:hypothetical protein
MKVLLPNQEPLPDGNRAFLTYGASDSLEHGSFKRKFRSLQGLPSALQQLKLILTDKLRLSFFGGVTVMRGYSVPVASRNWSRGAAIYFSSSG